MINDNDDDTWYMWIIVCGSNGSQDSSLVITRSSEPNRALSSPIPHDCSDNDGGDYVLQFLVYQNTALFSTEPNRALSSPIPHDRSDNDGGDYVFGWCGAFIGKGNFFHFF